MFCATSALGVSWQHLNHSNSLVLIIYRFHVRIILHHLDISLRPKDGFSKVKISYIKIAYCGVCDYYGVNSDKTWMKHGWRESHRKISNR